MPPYQYVDGFSDTVLDTSTSTWVPISDPDVQTAIENDDVLPSEGITPILTQREQVDTLISQAKPALAAANDLAGVKAVFDATLDGLRDIYGTPS